MTIVSRLQDGIHSVIITARRMSAGRQLPYSESKLKQVLSVDRGHEQTTLPYPPFYWSSDVSLHHYSTRVENGRITVMLKVSDKVWWIFAWTFMLSGVASLVSLGWNILPLTLVCLIVCTISFIGTFITLSRL